MYHQRPSQAGHQGFLLTLIPGMSQDYLSWNIDVFSFLPSNPECNLPVYPAAGWGITSSSAQGPYVATLPKSFGYTTRGGTRDMDVSTKAIVPIAFSIH